MKQLLHNYFLWTSIVLLLFSCTSSIDSKQTEERLTNVEKDFSYPNSDVVIVKSDSKTNFLSAKASIENMFLTFEVDLSKINKTIFPIVDNNDTLFTTVFFIDFTYNQQNIPIKISKKKHRWVYRNGLETQSDSLLLFTSGEQNLNHNRTVFISVPLYVFKNFSANKEIKIDVKVWQDYFLSERKEKITEINKVEFPQYYKDTIRKKVIDELFSFNLKIPEIYQTNFICDSIILQNDTSWSPLGSDHTLFRSSLPDIYFTLSDYHGSLQSSSDVEKSTEKFLIGDTLSFYHYQENEPFYVSVYDFDLLSKNDLLGEWKGKLLDMKNNKRYKLKFDHISAFYLKKKHLGKVN